MKWLLAFLPGLVCTAEVIYGVMITGLSPFHEKLAERAIESFFAQTYPNKHLIVVNDGNYVVTKYKPNKITEIRVRRKLKLGALRNIALERIPNEAMWVQWDDDDWNHPRRLEEQYAAIAKEKKAGCLMRNFLYYGFERNITLYNNSKFCPGTIMCRKKGRVTYPEDLGVGEDVPFRDKYNKKYGLFSWDNPRQYLLKFIHGKNVWAHILGKKIHKGRWKGDPEVLDYLKSVLPKYQFVYNHLRVPVPQNIK